MMSTALLIRLRPAGPWRYGPGDGAHDRVDSLFRSDRLYSAVCQAMLQLGHLEEWLEATARAAQPAAVMSSLFPFQGDILFAPPPETAWPPVAASLRTPSPVFLTKVRWRAAKFVPVSVIESLLMGTPLQADQWLADAESGCLLRRDRPQSSPFRIATRARVPVDRLTGASAEPHKAACVEFEPGAGLWTVVLFTVEEAASAWKERLSAAFRLLSDTGFGGSRSAGWGQASAPEFSDGTWPAILLPKLARAKSEEPLSRLHWLLSVYSPAESDAVEWGEGRYNLILRGGRVESKARWGSEKKTVRMVTEGSVLSASASIHGRAVDVAPEGFTHPVYRGGFAVALQLPVIHIVEAPEPEPAVSELDATLAAALAAAEEERAAAEPKVPIEGAEHVENELSEGPLAEAPPAHGHETKSEEALLGDSAEIASAEMEGSHPMAVSPAAPESAVFEALVEHPADTGPAEKAEAPPAHGPETKSEEALLSDSTERQSAEMEGSHPTAVSPTAPESAVVEALVEHPADTGPAEKEEEPPAHGPEMKSEEALLSDSTELESAEMEGSHPMAVSPAAPGSAVVEATPGTEGPAEAARAEERPGDAPVRPKDSNEI